MFVNIHTHFARNNYEIQQLYPDDSIIRNPFSIGIHPWHITNKWKEAMQEVYQKSKSVQCKLIGECGLDKNISDLSLQAEIFAEHIKLSEEIQKPLLIHCVKSYSEIISIKKKHQPKQIWIIHGFNKNTNVATELLKNGIKLSFGKAILANNHLQQIVTSIKDSDFFLETDDASMDIQEIYQKVSSIKNISLENLKNIQLENTKYIFNNI